MSSRTSAWSCSDEQPDLAHLAGGRRAAARAPPGVPRPDRRRGPWRWPAPPCFPLRCSGARARRGLPRGTRPGVGDRRVGALGSAGRFLVPLRGGLAISRPPVTSATAKQAMPSPRPSAPRPSARLPFTVTGAPTASREAPLHLVAARRELGRLEHDRAVDVAGRPARRPHVGDGPAQQVEAVGAGAARDRCRGSAGRCRRGRRRRGARR